MFKWFKTYLGKENLKVSKSADVQSVEVGTDAAVYDERIKPEGEAACVEENISTDMDIIQAVYQGEDFITNEEQTEKIWSVSSVFDGYTKGSSESSVTLSKRNLSGDVKKKLISKQEPTKSTSCSQKYVESEISTQEYEKCYSLQNCSESLCNSRKNRSSILELQDTNVYHNCNEFETLNKTKENAKLESSVFQASLSSETSIEPTQFPSCLENIYVHYKPNILEESARKNEEITQKTEDNTPKAHFTQKINKSVEVSVSHLLQEIPSVKVKENDHKGECHPFAVKENSNCETETDSSIQSKVSLFNMCVEEKFTTEYNKDSTKMEENLGTTVVKVDRSFQTSNFQYQCSNPYCISQTCLYNQKGRKCTIFDECFILTYLMESPVLVITKLQRTNIGSVGCTMSWCSGKLTEFRDLPDGTEVFFDAIVPPKKNFFVAIVIWQDSKPTHHIEPFFNSYVIVELIRNCPVKILSLGKKYGVASTSIYGKITKVVFSKSVMHNDGLKIEDQIDVKKLLNPTSNLHSDVLKLITVDNTDKVRYAFVCSCIWLGRKPVQLKFPTVYDPLKLYNTTDTQFSLAAKQSLLKFDVKAFLDVQDTIYKITFENEGSDVVLPCDRTKVFSGMHRVVPDTGGVVKVHLRNTLFKGKSKWLILMVQASPSLEAIVSCTRPGDTTEAVCELSPQISTNETCLSPPPTKSSPETVLSDKIDFHQTNGAHIDSDVVLRPQNTPISLDINSQHREPTVTSEIKPFEEHVKVLSESTCLSEAKSILKRKSQKVANNVGSKVSEDNEYTDLKLIRNGKGILKTIGEKFILEMDLGSKKKCIELGKAPLVSYENGVIKKCQAPMPDLQVGFDGHFANRPPVGIIGHVLALWSQKKPVKAYYEGNIFYFDSPGIYYGLDENGCFKFLVMLDGKINIITTTNINAPIFGASGEYYTSLAMHSYVFLHLRLSQGKWGIIFVIIESKSENSNSTQSGSKTPALPSSLESDMLKSCTMNKHYLKNLTGILIEKAGKKIIHTFYNNILLSVDVPEDCVVGVKEDAQNVKEISLSTEVQFDAFCDNVNSSEYWAVLIWLTEKPQKCITQTGSVFYYDVSGKCLSYSKNAVTLELIVENKTCYVASNDAYIIMSDGTLQVPESIRSGTHVHVNLLQQNESLSVNGFIFIDTDVGHSQQKSGAEIKSPEKRESVVARDMIKKLDKEEIVQKGSTPNISKTKNSKNKVLESLNENSISANENEMTTNCSNLKNPYCQYDIEKGRLTKAQNDEYTFSSISKNMKINIKPVEIALDSHLVSESLESEFYLVYHKLTRMGVCGWFQPEPREVYMHVGMTIHAHDPVSKILTLALPDSSSFYNFLFESGKIVTGSTSSRLQKRIKSSKRVHVVIEDIEPILLYGHVICHRVLFISTIKEVSAIYLNLLMYHLSGNEEKKVTSNGTTSNMNGSLLKDSNDLGSLTSSECISSESCVIQSQVNQPLDICHENNGMNREGKTLRELVSTNYPKISSKTHITRILTVSGEIYLDSLGTCVFFSKNISQFIKFTHELPHFDVNIREKGETIYMLVREVCAKDTGVSDYQPLLVWQKNRKCNPYIIITNKVSRKKNLLLITDVEDGKEKCYLFDYDNVFSVKKDYKVNELIQHSKNNRVLLYAVVNKVPHYQIEDQEIDGHILFLTTSEMLAASSIDVFVACCHENVLFHEAYGNVLEKLHLLIMRMNRAQMCKRGLTYYYSLNDINIQPNMKLVGCYLEGFINDFAIINNSKNNNRAICHLSNVYYQGEKIKSWETIPKQFWVNFWAILLPLDNVVQENNLEVNGLAVAAWCCGDPQTLAMHQCYYHVPTPYVVDLENEEVEETPVMKLLELQGNNLHHLGGGVGIAMSLAQLKNCRCQAGNAIFALNEDILHGCGLIKVNGKLTQVNGLDAVFTVNENEMVKCNIPSIFIKGKQCVSMKDIINKMDKTFTLVARKCSPTIYFKKIVQMEAIAAFMSKTSVVHVCKEHICTTQSNVHYEDIAIAEETFHDIAVLYQQSIQCFNYYLSYATIQEVEASISQDVTTKVKHTLCYGKVVDVEFPDQVIVSLKGEFEPLTLSVSRSRLMGFPSCLPLQSAVGHPLKSILYSKTREKKKFKILMSWGNFSNDTSTSFHSAHVSDSTYSQNSTFSCCSSGCKIKEFNQLYNRNIFDIKTFYKLTNVDTESGTGLFINSLYNNFITCEAKFIMGWPDVYPNQELWSWNLLVAKEPQTGKENSVAIAAWQGDGNSLEVKICDIHGIHLLSVSPRCSKTGDESLESPEGKQCDSNMSERTPRYKRYSESNNTSNTEEKYIMEEDDTELSRSLSCRSDFMYNSEHNIKEDCEHNLVSNSSFSTSLNTEKDSVIDMEQIYSSSEDANDHKNQFLSSSLIQDESYADSLSNMEPEDILLSEYKMREKVQYELAVLWPPSIHLRILLRKLETVFCCFVEVFTGHCGILLSILGPVLYDRNLLYMTPQACVVSKTPPVETENLKALVLELEKPIGFLGFEINKVAVAVWSEIKPVIDAEFLKKSVDLYKMSCDVELIGTLDQLKEEDCTKPIKKKPSSSDATMTTFFSIPSKECKLSEDILDVAIICDGTAIIEELSTVIAIEKQYAVIKVSNGHGLALLEDICCHNKVELGMKFQAVCVKLPEPLSIFSQKFEFFALFGYMCSIQPCINILKLDWVKGNKEKIVEITMVGAKMKKVNLRIKAGLSPSMQPNSTALQSHLQSLDHEEDTTLVEECVLVELMDESGILKVKDPSNIKIYFHWRVVMINNESLAKEEWKETLQVLMDHKHRWQCSGRKVTSQERVTIKEVTGQEVQYNADLVWCKTCIKTKAVQAEMKTFLDTELVQKHLKTRDGVVDDDIQHSDDNDDTCTNKDSNKRVRSSRKTSKHAIVQPSQRLDHSTYSFCQGSLWTARSTLRIILEKQDTVRDCILACSADHCGILASAIGPILFDSKLIDHSHHDVLEADTPKSLNVLTLELEQPVEVLGYEIRKVAVALWNEKKPSVDKNVLLEKVDAYKYNWIVVIVNNVSTLAENDLKQIAPRSFSEASFEVSDASNSSELIYYCSQTYSVGEYHVVLSLTSFILLKHEDNFVLAMRDDVMCNDNIKEKQCLWAITVKLNEPFRFCSHLITNFALLVYDRELEPPEADAIKLKCYKGKIEKKISFEEESHSLRKMVNIRVKVFKPIVTPYNMHPLWTLTPDRPEKDVLFAVECEVVKINNDYGILKAKGRTLINQEIKIFFENDSVLVLINSKPLEENAPLSIQMSVLEKQSWRCTCERLTLQEAESLEKKVGEEVHYKAKMVWREDCPSAHTGPICNDKANEVIPQTPGTPMQSEAANTSTICDQIDGKKDLCAMNTSQTSVTKRKKRSKKTKATPPVGNNRSEEQPHIDREGHLTEVYHTIVQLVLEDGQLRYVNRENCFLYSLRLNKVELWHVLSIGLKVKYELTDDGNELRKIWVGRMNIMEPQLLQNKISHWCETHNVAPFATKVLLLQAGSLSSDLTPIAAFDEDQDVIDVTTCSNTS